MAWRVTLRRLNHILVPLFGAEVTSTYREIVRSNARRGTVEQCSRRCAVSLEANRFSSRCLGPDAETKPETGEILGVNSDRVYLLRGRPREPNYRVRS